MKLLHALPFAVTLLVACGPSETDRANMTEKMALETARAQIWTTNLKDCAKLGSESTAFNKENHDKHERLDAWWGGVGSRAKKKLEEENRAAWDAQSLAMVRVFTACPAEAKASMKGH